MIVPLTMIAALAAGGGDERFWLAGAGGSFHDPANWDGPVPEEGVTAVFDILSSYTVTFDSSAFSDRLLIRDGQVALDLDNNPYELLNPLAGAPSLVVGESTGTAASLSLGGGLLRARFTNLGHEAGAYGSLVVSTPGSVLDNDFHTRVGFAGTGTMDVLVGGLVVDTVGVIGVEEDGLGLVTVAGAPALWSSAASLIVGDQGTGFLQVVGGGVVISGAGVVGKQLGSSGHVTVSGSSSFWTVEGPFDVGQSGTGALTISGGGTVHAQSFATVGTFPEPDPDFDIDQVGVGDVLVTGPGSTWLVNGELHVGFMAVGSLTVAGGGSVVSGDAFVSTDCLFDLIPCGGDVTITGAGSSWFAGGPLVSRGSIEVRDDGLIESSSFELDEESALLVLSGGAIAADVIAIDEDATVTGDGLVDGAVINAGRLQPGLPQAGEQPLMDEIGTLTIDGSVALEATSVLEIVVDAFPDILADRVDVTGPVALAGALHVVRETQTLLSLGDEFLIVTGSSITGQFDTITGDEPNQGEWRVFYGTSEVRLVVVDPSAGDVNNDGVVDVLDLVAVITSWGACPDPPDPCPADIDGDGTVGVADLIAVILGWS